MFRLIRLLFCWIGCVRLLFEIVFGVDVGEVVVWVGIVWVVF